MRSFVYVIAKLRESNKLEASLERSRKAERKGERRTICRGHIGRQLWASELFALWQKASAIIPLGTTENKRRIARYVFYFTTAVRLGNRTGQKRDKSEPLLRAAKTQANVR